jgi:4-hydroxy-tetrahydrodipicolinate synthase
MFCEPSPAPAKYGASLLGLMTNEVRLPILPTTPVAEARVRAAMVIAGLVN